MQGAAVGQDATPGRLLVLSDTLAGGLGALVRLQAEWFASRRWEVTVAAPDDGPRPPSPSAFRSVPAVDSARRIVQMNAVRRALRALRSRVDDRTVVHIHGMRSLLLARAARLPTPFVSVHGAHADVNDPPGYARLRRLWLAAVPHLCVRAVTGEPGYGGAWVYEPHASPLLHDLDVLPMPTGSVPTVCWLGGLDTRKQPEIFVRAIAEVARQGQPIRGLLGGSGERTGEIAQLARDLDAPVQLLGQADAVDVLRRSWALALFARSEGTPLAVIEAMWAGRSVIGSPVPGIEHVVGDTGTIAGDVAEAAAAITAFVSDRQLATERGLAAAERIRDLLGPWTPWDTTEPHYLDYLRRRTL